MRLLPLLLSIVAVSFPLHLAWEWAQCRPFFIHGAVPGNVESMLIATLGDLVLTLVAYAVMSTIHGADWPLRPWTPRVWIALSILALVLSISIEVYAIHTGRWTYTEAAPRIPGTAVLLLPVAQLLILFPLSFRLARPLVSYR